MANAEPAIFNLTKPVILAHPNLFEARAFGAKGKEKGDAKFSGNFVFDKDHPDLKPLRELAAKVAKARWPGRDLKELKFPFSLGDTLADKRKARTGKDDGEYQRGKVIVAARSKYAPNLSIIEPGRGLVDLEGDARIAAKGKFFFGAEVLAQFNLVAYEGGNGPDGVTAYLNLVLATGKGKKIAGAGPSAAEAFKGYVGTATDYDPTDGQDGLGADLDDEIPY